MVKLTMRLDTKVGLAVAAIFAFFSILLFGNAILKVADSTASCMEEAHGASEATRECSRVEPEYFWGPIVIISALGFFAGAVCFSNGRREGEKVLLEYLNRNNLKQQKMSGADVEKIVHAYSAAVLSRKSMISDTSELPYPKPVIKAALIAAISLTKDSKMREQLKTGYVSLADWQEGVGPGPHAFETTQADLDDPMAAMKRIKAAGPSFTEIPTRVAAEAQNLFDELKALGL